MPSRSHAKGKTVVQLQSHVKGATLRTYHHEAMPKVKRELRVCWCEQEQHKRKKKKSASEGRSEVE
jgi:hypothetical protein